MVLGGKRNAVSFNQQKDKYNSQTEQRSIVRAYLMAGTGTTGNPSFPSLLTDCTAKK